VVTLGCLYAEIEGRDEPLKHCSDIRLNPLEKDARSLLREHYMLVCEVLPP